MCVEYIVHVFMYVQTWCMCVCVCACIHVIYNYVILYKIENQDTGADMVCESVCVCVHNENMIAFCCIPCTLQITHYFTMQNNLFFIYF